MGVTRPGAALRDCVGECAADSNQRAGGMDVERKENPNTRRRAFQDTAFHAILFVAEGCGPLLGGIRRVQAREERGVARLEGPRGTWNYRISMRIGARHG